ncbi:DUF885 domain-containing protein [SAR92 clade bacterium H231]|jgi:uncharacterized protein (DUF885 family)|nr:DUF885 domain-containing protein [Porticoccaceae bacterium]MBT7259360.1 DUF885 domain-containing protein [Porticoccaceae bacterium]MCT2533877.1 DUF885 domain-containing protein [SAR92 clade bacterium H231]MDG1448131.1 DUF885 domain-containing protein [Porticoccaceae bacterium]
MSTLFNISKMVQRLGLLVGILLLTAMSAQSIAALSDYQARLDLVTEENGYASQDERLAALMDLVYDYQMTQYPEAATWLGYAGQNDRWTDYSPEAIEQRNRDSRTLLKAVETISVDSLGESAILDFQLFHKDLSANVAAQAFPDELMPINQMGGVQQDLAQMISLMPSRKLTDYRDIIARLESADSLIMQTIVLMKQGLEAGITPPAITLRDVPGQVANQLFDDPMDSPLLGAFVSFPDSISPDQQKQLKARAIAAYQNGIAPAYKKLQRFLETDYLPNAVQAVGLSNLANGQAWYAHRAARSTTTDLTAEQIHALGLREVARIRAAMEQVIIDSGFEGDFDAFTEFLRRDPQFYFTNKEDLMREYRDIAKRADAELPALFGVLPRLPYGVKMIPSYAEKSQTTAYYQSGAQSMGRAGIFFANTYALDTRPKWEMEALTLHEAMPGHHLQISLAKEQTNVHPWRRDLYRITAFVEGWGLYSESLGEEMGFYKDPYSKFGQLTYEMWRAVRLVVDTGMHSLGWSRQRAIDFFIANSAKSEHDITVEIDRYIVWPGQALAYKMGELKIKELRQYASQELGEDFDIRSFHDRVLEAGPIPLDILEQRIKDWVAGQ